MICLGSTSDVKWKSLKKVVGKFGVADQVVREQAPSRVPAQPQDYEIVLGAINRATYVSLRVPAARITLGIESGISKKRSLCLRRKYIGKTIIAALITETREWIIVEGNEGVFPVRAVRETFRRGDTWTVGKVLEERGKVKQHDDPQRSLTGKSREEYLEETLSRLFEELRERGLI